MKEILDVMSKKKLDLIVLGTGDATVQFINKCFNNDKINIIGNIPDDSLPLDVLNEYDDKTLICPKFKFEEKYLKKADLIFSIEYRRIVPRKYVNKYLFVNCHGGILPKWRGFACNAWAIMNGEKEIGYSIHEMNDKLDDGRIFFVKRIPIDIDQTYSDVHEFMINSIVTEAPHILVDIAFGKNVGIEQKGSFCYCNRFSPSFGELKNFDKCSYEIINLYRCKSKPLGTGLYFVFRNQRYDVGKVEDATKYGLAKYKGIPGKIINIHDNKIWVKTKDTGLVLSDIRRNDDYIMVSEYFRIGFCLNA